VQEQGGGQREWKGNEKQKITEGKKWEKLWPTKRGDRKQGRERTVQLGSKKKWEGKSPKEKKKGKKVIRNPRGGKNWRLLGKGGEEKNHNPFNK